ncbi:dynein heavy chain [Mayamaea pseudoterrestris]|nr:dynein heavy chain [Mayamaea pseudoterrestris]
MSSSLDLPQIVVVGGQSSGKSSVLESIVGRSFLPRGTGIVTRRPLILQLFNTSTKESKSSEGSKPKDIQGSLNEYGEFLHMPGRKFHDFSAIRQEIVAETERLTGRNKGVDATPIRLKIYSPYVLALTLVDLPGVAKIPVGDQPHDIEKQIQNMCLEYIQNPNAIVLAVTSANTDLANSDAIKMAQSVDPLGLRTVGVLTKVDLMDQETDCADILNNLVIPLRRGYVAVVNRGQKDIVSDMQIRDGLIKEEKFFRTHAVYGKDRNLLAKCGTPRLAKNLNSMLMHHIRDVLPDLKTRITHMMSDVQTEIDTLGSPALTSRSSRGGALLGLLSKFANNFGSLLDGHGAKDANAKMKNSTTQNELWGGARISYIFTEVFASSLISVGAFDGLTNEEIRTTIANANGTRPSLFIPEISFDILVRRQITRLEQPGIQCVDLVYEELQRIASQAEPNELTRFPLLRDRMLEVVQTLLRRAMNPTQLMVSNLVKIELAYVNTSHPDFVGGSQAVAGLMSRLGKESKRGIPRTPLLSSPKGNQYDEGDDEDENLPTSKDVPPGNASGIMSVVFRGTQSPTPRKVAFDNSGTSIVHLSKPPQTMKQTDVPMSDREQVEMEVIKSLIESYFAIVQKNFIDMVPKTIMYFLVNHVRDSLQNELVKELYRDAEVGQLMNEAEDIAERRERCNETKELLGKALDIVNEVRDFNTFK